MPPPLHRRWRNWALAHIKREAKRERNIPKMRGMACGVYFHAKSSIVVVVVKFGDIAGLIASDARLGSLLGQFLSSLLQ